jgi:hypothetical protein
MGEAFRFRNGLYSAISDNIPTAVAQIMANGMAITIGNLSCIENRKVKYAENVSVAAWTMWKKRAG